MVRIAVFGDTHVPSRADEIPDWVCEEVAAADRVIHTGDFDSSDALETVQDLADGDLVAVAGNIDPDLGLPAVEVLEVGEVTLVVTHGTGDLDSYEERVAGIAREEGGGDAIAVSGHTHAVTDTIVEGTRLLNPGSATGVAPATVETTFILEVTNGEIDLTHHEQ
jgi:putative phosphoesterase